MAQAAPECPTCRRAMIVGFLLEGSQGERLGVTRWVEGRPEKSFWSGLKTGDRAMMEVTSYRCPKCGRLESFAHPAGPA